MEKTRLRLDRRGQGLAEYIILMLLIAIVSIAAAKGLGATIKRKIELAQRHINEKVDLNPND